MKQRLMELIDGFREMDAPSDGRGWTEHLADHLLENGVIVPPIPYGTELHFLWSREHADRPKPPCIHSTDEWIFKIRSDGKMWLSSNDIPCGYFGEYLHQLGKTVFLTREEAEKALAERGGR